MDSCFRSVGDVNFFENGILIRKDPDCKTGYYIIRCMPLSDQENRFLFGELYVDISDDWIDRADVIAAYGLDDSSNTENFAIACTDYYPWPNFGVEYLSRSYNWTNASREEIQSVLEQYRAAGLFRGFPVSLQ